MTKEELKKEAEEWCGKKNLTSSNVGYFTSAYCEQSYIASAEPREKRIAELEAQIEKMKCCGNCRFNYCEKSSECIDKDGNRTFHCWNEEKEKYCDVGKNGKYQCWEIKEK